MINNINMRLMQLERIKKELKWITYELNKCLELFLYYESFSILIYLILFTIWTSGTILEKLRVCFVNSRAWQWWSFYSSGLRVDKPKIQGLVWKYLWPKGYGGFWAAWSNIGGPD
jgi:hypothetical protein